MTVQVGEIFDLHRFLFSVEGGLYMPEQSVHHQEKTEADQQIISYKIQNAKEYGKCSFIHVASEVRMAY